MVDDGRLRLLIAHNVDLLDSASQEVIVQELLETNLVHFLFLIHVSKASQKSQRKRDDPIRPGLIVWIHEEAFQTAWTFVSVFFLCVLLA